MLTNQLKGKSVFEVLRLLGSQALKADTLELHLTDLFLGGYKFSTKAAQHPHSGYIVLQEYNPAPSYFMDALGLIKYEVKSLTLLHEYGFEEFQDYINIIGDDRILLEAGAERIAKWMIENGAWFAFKPTRSMRENKVRMKKPTFRQYDKEWHFMGESTSVFIKFEHIFLEKGTKIKISVQS